MRTTTIKLDGNLFAAKSLADMEVNRLLEIFRKQTSFQNLQQNKQRVNLVGGPFDGAHVTLTTQFGIETVEIFVPPRVVVPPLVDRVDVPRRMIKKRTSEIKHQQRYLGVVASTLDRPALNDPFIYEWRHGDVVGGSYGFKTVKTDDVTNAEPGRFNNFLKAGNEVLVGCRRKIPWFELDKQFECYLDIRMIILTETSTRSILLRPAVTAAKTRTGFSSTVTVGNNETYFSAWPLGDVYVDIDGESKFAYSVERVHEEHYYLNNMNGIINYNYGYRDIQIGRVDTSVISYIGWFDGMHYVIGGASNDWGYNPSVDAAPPGWYADAVSDEESYLAWGNPVGYALDSEGLYAEQKWSVAGVITGEGLTVRPNKAAPAPIPAGPWDLENAESEDYTFEFTVPTEPHHVRFEVVSLGTSAGEAAAITAQEITPQVTMTFLNSNATGGIVSSERSLYASSESRGMIESYVLIREPATTQITETEIEEPTDA